MPFPARAGMNRLARRSGMAGGAVPRARGDEPQINQASLNTLYRSPRARG